MSHWPSEALRLPVTGSSAGMPSLGKNARTSTSAGAPRLAARPGRRDRRGRPWSGTRRGRAARTASADRSSSAIQPGPLSTHCESSTSDGSSLHRVDHVGDEVRFDRAAAHERRRREREPVAVAAHRDQSGAALLDGDARLLRDAAVGAPRPARAERRMPGERQLAERRPDPDAVVGGVARRRQDERRLRQVRPARDRRHRLVVDPVGVEHDGERIAEERRLAEHVDLDEASRHVAIVDPGSSRRAPVRGRHVHARTGSLASARPSTVNA